MKRYLAVAVLALMSATLYAKTEPPTATLVYEHEDFQARIPGPGGKTTAAGAPTSSPSVGNVGSASASTTGITTPGTTFAGTSGALVLLTSHTGIPSGAPTSTVVFTVSGATCSASSLNVTTNNGVSSVFQEAVAWCLLSNTATVTPSVTWTGALGNFTSLTTRMFTSTSGFQASPLDQSVNTANSAVNGTSCPSGNTSATTNANDLVVGMCWNFNASQTYPAGTTGYTTFPAGSTNSTTVQYKNVSATGVQSFTVTISSDVWASAVYAFKMN